MTGYGRRKESANVALLAASAHIQSPLLFNGTEIPKPKVNFKTGYDYVRLGKAEEKRQRKNAKRLKQLNVVLIERVRRALKNAKENGYLFDGWSFNGIANDLINYDSDLENENLEKVADAVRIVGGIN